MTVPTTVRASFTRPANATQYTAGNVVSTLAGALLQFQLMAGNGQIMTARLVDGANQATPGSFELYLFSAAPAVRADNAALALSAAEAATLIGVIPFVDTPYATNGGAGAAGNLTFCELSNLPFSIGPAGGFVIYGLLVVRNAYTPVSAETFAVQLGVI